MRRLLILAALAAFSLPAMADDSADRAAFAKEVKSCSKLPAGDSRSLLDCVGDQVLALDGHLGDIVSETLGFVEAKDAKPLKTAQRDWQAYRASTCSYHKGRAAEEPEMAELFCLFRITTQRIAEIQANDDFANPKAKR